MSLKDMGVEHYYSFGSTVSPEKRREKLQILVNSGKYIQSEKIDGNFARVVIEPDFSGLQTRGTSTKDGEHLCINDRVFFWDSIIKAFSNTTVLLGEVYFPNGGIDRYVSGVLRMKPEKAMSVQDKTYYTNIQKTIKFTAKDKRDIEQNQFFGQHLHYRIFDVLYYNGKSLMDSPIEERVSYIDLAVHAINDEHVEGAKYWNCVPETFYDMLDEILARGGEGLVLTKKGSLYEPDAKSARAWKTLKCKRELQETIDAFITNVIPCTQEYTGKSIQTWQLWMNTRTGELKKGDFYNSYSLGEPLMPITKNYYHGWCGAIECSVFDKNGNIIPIANVAGLSEELKEDLKNNFDKYYKQVASLSGMMVSEGAKTNTNSGYSVRHPKLITLRDDIDITDCTLEKITRE